MNEDIVYRLRKRAEIRRQIPTRKSVQEGVPDKIADLLEEAAQEILKLRQQPYEPIVSKVYPVIVNNWKTVEEDRVENIWQHLKDREPIKDSYNSSFHCCSQQYEMHGMIYECTFAGSETPIDIQWKPKS